MNWRYSEDDINEAVQGAMTDEKQRYMEEYGINLEYYPWRLSEIEKRVRESFAPG
jgi:hypothetical protein